MCKQKDYKQSEDEVVFMRNRLNGIRYAREVKIDYVESKLDKLDETIKINKTLALHEFWRGYSSYCYRRACHNERNHPSLTALVVVCCGSK